MANKLRQSVPLTALAILLPLAAQEIRLDGGPLNAGPRRQHMELETQRVDVHAGRSEWIELRFRVDPGFHVNSHTPHDELLIPTVLQLTPLDSLKVTSEEYPAGVPLRLEGGTGETLSTYQGEFRVRVQVLAHADSILAGTLRYQACDAHSCFPAKSLPVRVPLTAR